MQKNVIFMLKKLDGFGKIDGGSVEKKKRLRKLRDAEKTVTLKIAGFRILQRRFLRKM